MSGFVEHTLALVSVELLKQRLCKTVVIPSPAVGADFSITVPGGVTWEFVALFSTLNTSAVVANRTPTLLFSDADSNILARWSAGSISPGSSTSRQVWAAGLGGIASATVSEGAVPYPAQPLFSGYTIKSLTGLLDAGDFWNQLNLTIREWDVTGIAQELDEIIREVGQYFDVDDRPTANWRD